MNKEIFDIGIVGGGPAGYALALRTAMGGASVILFEREKLGGTCLNKGCIPTKSILHNTNLIFKSKSLEKFGIKFDKSDFDFAKIIDYKNNTVQKLNKSLGMLLKSYDIEIAEENVLEIGKNKIITNSAEYNCKNIVLATGTVPAQIKGLETDNEFIFNSDEILNLQKLPKSVVIIGSGAIGVEWSRIFSDLGVEVTLVEAMAQILPAADEDVSSRMERLLKKKRVKIEKSVTVDKISDKKVKLTNGKELTPEIVFVAIGRKPVLPKCDKEFETIKNYLKVDENFMTNIDGIYAIGDINGRFMLAHSATHQAIELSDYLTKGIKPEFSQKDIPSVIYGVPEAAWFGKTEAEIKQRGINYKKVLFPVSAVGKAHTDEEIDGFVKIIAYEDKILSAAIVAPEASSMLMQLLIAKENNLSYQQVLKAVFPHPTFSEAVFEAILALDEQSLSIPKIKGD